MALDDIVQETITLNSSAPTQAGFGRGLFCAYHALFAGRTKLYKGADEMLTDGFLTTDKVYQDALAYKSQRPCPVDFKVGRLALPATQIVELTPLTFGNLENYTGKIAGAMWTFTGDGTATLAEACTGIAAAITALARVTAVSTGGTKVTVTTDAAGDVVQYTEMTPNLGVKDVSADPGIATDLAAIQAADNDWFGLALSCPNSELIVNAAAAWVETKRKLFVWQSADTDLTGGSTTDLGSDLKGFKDFNSCGFYHPYVASVMPAAVLGMFLPYTPGSATMAFKSLVGIPTYVVSTSVEALIQGRNVNTYTTIAGNGTLYPGKQASGEYADQTVGIHELYARIQEAVIGLFQANPKVGYTDQGAAAVQGTIKSVLDVRTRKPSNFLVPGTTVVTVPEVASVSASDKAARLLPNVTFSATLQGAIHATKISGQLAV